MFKSKGRNKQSINDVRSSQVLRQIQIALRAGSRQMTQKGWNVSAERLERNSDDNLCQKTRSSSRSEPFRSRLRDEDADNTHDSLLCSNVIGQMAGSVH